MSTLRPSAKTEPALLAELEAHFAAELPADGQTAPTPKPLAKLHGNAAPILARLAAGETVAQVAKACNTTRAALGSWLLKHAAEQYRDVLAGHALSDLEDCESDLQNAPNQVDVSAARERAAIARWKLERLVKLFAPPKDAASQGVTVNVIVNREGAIRDPLTIEAQA